MFRKIVTLMLNPAIDVTANCDSFEPGKENRVTSERFDAAGKAVNVSRVLKSAGMDSTAVILAGEGNAEIYISKLKDEITDTVVIAERGMIRENISIVLPDGSVTRLLRAGFQVLPGTIEAVKNTLQKICTAGSCCVIAGSLPPGIDQEALLSICMKVKAGGAALAIDTRSFSLRRLLQVKPFVIKPNDEEFDEMLGRKTTSLEDKKQEMLALVAAGIPHVLLSLGANGMLYASAEGVYYAAVPDITPISTVGAGDSSLAGFLLAVQNGEKAENILRRAASFGTAACLTAGTNAPSQRDIEKVYPLIQIEVL